MRGTFLAILLLAGTCCFAQSVPAPTQPITKETVERRLAKLQAEYDQAIANANALQGAIQDCKYWLDQIKAAEAKPAIEQKDAPKK